MIRPGCHHHHRHRRSDQDTQVPPANLMCKTKKSVQATEPNSSPAKHRTLKSSASFNDPNSANFPFSTNDNNSSYNFSSKSSASSSSVASLKTLKSSLPENLHIYDMSEIRSATSNFLNHTRLSSSSTSSSWRCSLRGKDAVVFQRKSRLPLSLNDLRDRLSQISKSNHTSLIKLLGASLSGSYVYLVYEFVPGATLSDCLRNPKNPTFTVLPTWLTRMQVATDLAHGLDYIHHCSGLTPTFVHNHIKTSSVIVSDGGGGDAILGAKICHFGTAELCGESQARSTKLEGTRGYMAPEFQLSGVVTQKCDVYAFGVVLLELISGEEPLKYTMEGDDGGYKRVSVIDTARDALGNGGRGGVRRWVDRRLKDSFPMEVAEKMVMVALECVEEDPDKRPDMGRIAGLVSKLFLESQRWAEKMGMPIDLSVSFAPR